MIERTKEGIIQVPDFVHEEIKYRRSVSDSGIAPSNGLLLQGIMTDMYGPGRLDRPSFNGYFDESEFYYWMQSSDNIIALFEAVIQGYIAKEARFWLKHIDVSKASEIADCFLVPSLVDSTMYHLSKPKRKYPAGNESFTQEELDKMNISSYKKILVRK